MEERLQKVIAAAGITSRRKAEVLISEGRVRVNRELVTEPGRKVTEQDLVEVDGVPLKKEEKVYYLMNKPKHVLCTLHDDREGKPYWIISMSRNGSFRSAGWITIRPACCC